MTFAQFIECIGGKVAAMLGIEVDGTPFNNIDVKSLQETLEGLGFNGDGTEEMYNGMTGKKIKSRIFIGPLAYQRLKHQVADKLHCLTMDHEVLTNNGWKYYDDIKMSDKIATLKDNKLVYDTLIKKLYYLDYRGKLYHIKSQQIDLNVTMNHRMYVSCKENDEWLPYELKIVDDIIGRKVRYLKMDDNNKQMQIILDNYEEIITETENTQVFCLQVPSEVFYVRRNGKSVWTGNSRARGPRQLLTRQCPEGRARDGGLRFGEMERDAMLSNGLARFLKERMLETADLYTTYICGVCGLLAQRLLKKDNRPYPTSKDIWYCPKCKNYTNIHKIRIPYAFKLFHQEMMAMNIAPRIRVKESKYD